MKLDVPDTKLSLWKKGGQRANDTWRPAKQLNLPSMRNMLFPGEKRD